MDFLALIIAIVAFGLARNSVQQIDVIQNLQQQIDELHEKIKHTTKGGNKVNEDIHDAVREFIGSLKNRQSR